MDENNSKRQNSSARMNEIEFRAKWSTEKSIYKAWGDFVVSEIVNTAKQAGKNSSEFFKVPPSSRLKDDSSLIDKAFYRKGKSYDDPYNQIEDKVGARFVVLLLADIEYLCNAIVSSNNWDFDPCKHFDEDRKKDPMLFTYQSVHYILRPKREIEFNGIVVPCSTACEVQIRTLLQHAHAELTHDAIYKAKKAIEPEVHRTVAKSMALIETTDDFFGDVTRKLNSGPVEEFGIKNKIQKIYHDAVGEEPKEQKSAIVVWDAFEKFVVEDLDIKIDIFISKNKYLSEIIKERFYENNIYQQSVVLFVYWLLKKRRNRLLADWPLSRNVLELLANDIGVSTWKD